MKTGEFPDGSRTLRAKIDMSLAELQPARSGHVPHPARRRITAPATSGASIRCTTGPTARCDSIEKITHSICTLEFENHRPLYDWFVKALGIYAPQQIEFARLNLTYTVLSKRKLLELVQEKHVNGWDDPRMPTICGLRRRGYTPEAIRDVLRAHRRVEVQRHHRHGLAGGRPARRPEQAAPARMAVLRPLKVVIENYPEGQTEELDAVNNPEDPAAGTRKVPFARELYIEQDDFREDPPKDFFRLAPGREVRLR